VVLPTLVMALYFLFWAADGFVSEARFAVRSNDAQNASVLGILSGMPASTIVSDSYIVSDYIHSREMVEALESRIGLRAIYSRPEADFFTRLDSDATLEELISYWKTRADVYYDSTKNTIAVEVQAFSPQDAQRVTAAIVDIARNLVNELSAQSRRDAVGFAAGEVARAELRVRGARQDMLAFRTEHNEFDPTATAAATLELTSQLEAERSQLNSQLAAVSGYLSANAPSVQMLKARIAALGGEIGRVQNQISQDPAATTGNDPTGNDPIGERLAAASGTHASAGGASAGSAAPQGGAPNSGALANVVGRYQELLLSQEFAETAYTAAQASLEAARTDAARTQSYLALYVHPHIAEDATYPRRGLNILMVLILATVLWAVGALTAMTVRDHMP
jgi:capsular polysaccharide transport system permease protein